MASQVVKYILDSGILNKFKIFVDQSYEICGNITHDLDKGKLVLIDMVSGDNKNNRNMCTVKSLSTYIFHSHPSIRYAYPSFEDLNNVSKHGRVKNSIIACKWGLWQIVKIDEKKIDYLQSARYEDYIRYALNNLGINTSIRAEHMSKNYSEEVQNYIDIFITKINKLGNIKVVFQDWESIKIKDDNNVFMIH